MAATEKARPTMIITKRWISTSSEVFNGRSPEACLAMRPKTV